MDGDLTRNDRPVADVDDMGLRLLLAGTDGSDGSRRALRWSAQLAQITGAKVLAVHVLTYSHELLRDVTPDTMRTWRRELHDEMQTHWIEPLSASSVPYRTLIVEHDSAAGGLLATADSEGADVVIVGANGHGSLADRVLGGVSYRIVHRSPRPVIVVPGGTGAA